MTALELKLVLFARDVLEVLERDKDWSADTLQSIGDAADTHGLVEKGLDGCFRARLD